jgi:hypothetical protein
MFQVFVAIIGAGLAHFLIGGLWYSPLMFSKQWMTGLGLTMDDIKEVPVDMRMALLASAASSFVQAAALVWLFVTHLSPTPFVGALIGLVAAFAFGFMPMWRDRVWANRPWSVILIDAGYECVAGTVAGALAALVLTMMAQ